MDDAGAGFGDAGEELAEGTGTAAANFLVVSEKSIATTSRGDGGDSAKNGKKADQGGDVEGQVLADFGFRQFGQETAETIDDSVESLVGYGLSVETAPGQDDSARVGSDCGIQKLAEKG